MYTWAKKPIPLETLGSIPLVYSFHKSWLLIIIPCVLDCLTLLILVPPNLISGAFSILVNFRFEPITIHSVLYLFNVKQRRSWGIHYLKDRKKASRRFKRRPFVRRLLLILLISWRREAFFLSFRKRIPQERRCFIEAIYTGPRVWFNVSLFAINHWCTFFKSVFNLSLTSIINLLLVDATYLWQSMWGNLVNYLT